MNKRWRKFFAIFLSATMSMSFYVTPVFAETTGETVAAETIFVSRTSGSLDWEITTDGTFTLEGDGEYTCDVKVGTGAMQVPTWCADADQIKRAVIKVKNNKYASSMFYGCKNMTSVDFRGSDTSNVIDVSSMFYDCRSLDSIDLTGLNTS